MAEGEAVVGQGAEHDGRVDDVLLKTQKARVEALEPHQLGVVWRITAEVRALPPSV